MSLPFTCCRNSQHSRQVVGPPAHRHLTSNGSIARVITVLESKTILPSLLGQDVRESDNRRVPWGSGLLPLPIGFLPTVSRAHRESGVPMDPGLLTTIRKCCRCSLSINSSIGFLKMWRPWTAAMVRGQPHWVVSHVCHNALDAARLNQESPVHPEQQISAHWFPPTMARVLPSTASRTTSTFQNYEWNCSFWWTCF